MRPSYIEFMKKNKIFILIFFILFSSCDFFTKKSNEDTDNAMYEEFFLSNDILKSTGLPTVFIQTEGNSKIFSKEDWTSATIEISNASDEEWNFGTTEVSIRGRGNYSWEQPKRSYALKFSKKQSVCGMPKHKRWVLLANYNDNSFMKNVVAFYLSKQLGMEYTVRGEYVNLVLNGNYVGLYWLGEAIKVDKSRVNINKKNDYLIEMDIYYDESWKFHSKIKKLPYMIKNDDFLTVGKFLHLKKHISKMESILYNSNFPFSDETKTTYDETYKKYIDLKSFAQFYLVNEIMYNEELGHPKSCYFTLKSETGILKSGPVWDFDWAGYNPANSLELKTTIYYDALFKIPEFNAELNTLMSKLSTSEISSEINSIEEYIRASVDLDGKRWGTEHRNPVGESRNNFDEYTNYLKDCVLTRVEYMKNNLF